MSPPHLQEKKPPRWLEKGTMDEERGQEPPQELAAASQQGQLRNLDLSLPF